MDEVWSAIIDVFVSRWIKASDSVLDVGAGACHFINHVRAARRVAFDANPETKGYCAPGVEFVQGDSVDALGNATFDAVFLSNILEHLDGPQAVIALLSALRSHIKPGGRIIILQPNFALVGARYFDFIDHKTILTERSLEEALALSGYRVSFMRKRFLPYTSKSSLPKAGWLVRLYLRFPPAQFLLGKQTFVVAEPLGDF